MTRALTIAAACFLSITFLVLLQSHEQVVARSIDGPILDQEVEIWLDGHFGRTPNREGAIEEIAAARRLCSFALDTGLGSDPVAMRIVRTAELLVWSHAAKRAVNARTARPSPESIDRWIHGRDIDLEDLVRLRSIFIETGTEDAEGQSRARSSLNELRSRIQTEEITFAEAARQYSDSESSSSGGLSGLISSAQVAPQFAEIIFTLDDHEISEIVESPRGLHLFTVDQRIAAKHSDRAALEERAEASLLAEAQAAAWAELRRQTLERANPRIELANIAGPADAVVMALEHGELIHANQVRDLATLPLEKSLRRLEELAFLIQLELEAPDSGIELSKNDLITTRLRHTRKLADLFINDEAKRTLTGPTEEEILAVWNRDPPKLRSRPSSRIRSARFDLRKPEAIDAAKYFAEAQAWPEEMDESDSRPEIRVEWIENRKLAQFGPAAVETLRTAAEGETIGPHRLGTDLWVLQILERRAAMKRPLEEVRAAIVRNLDSVAKRQVFDELYDRALLEANLELEADLDPDSDPTDTSSSPSPRATED